MKPYKVSVDYWDKDVFEQRFPQQVHQHIAAECAPLPLYDENSLKQPVKEGLYVLLDSITDPHNFGACVRSAVAYGADGIIFTKHNTAPLNAACCKAAAGMIEWIKLIRVANAARALDLMKKKGYWVVATDSQARQSISSAHCSPPLVLIMGSESKGIHRLLVAKSDYHCRIPTHKLYSSLNVSLATALCLYIIRHKQGWEEWNN